jgi:hypothetical protein
VLNRAVTRFGSGHEPKMPCKIANDMQPEKYLKTVNEIRAYLETGFPSFDMAAYLLRISHYPTTRAVPSNSRAHPTSNL